MPDPTAARTFMESRSTGGMGLRIAQGHASRGMGCDAAETHRS